MSPRPLRIPVVPPPSGEFFWLPTFIDECDCCGTRTLLNYANRCPGCDCLARAAAERGQP